MEAQVLWKKITDSAYGQIVRIGISQEPVELVSFYDQQGEETT